MEYWIIQIKPFSPKKRNENIVLNFQKDCIRNNLFGMGWNIDDNAYPAGEPMPDYEEYQQKWLETGSGNVSKTAYHAYQNIQAGDLVLFRDRNAKYYIAKVKTTAQWLTEDTVDFETYHNAKEAEMPSNPLSWACRVEKWYPISDVPSAVVGRFSQRRQQTIRRIADTDLQKLADILYSVATQTTYQKIPIHAENFCKAMNPDELEDLTAMWILDKNNEDNKNDENNENNKKSNFCLLPSSCKRNTPKYEFELLGMEKESGKIRRITCQVKNQEEIHADDYSSDTDTYWKIYLFSGIAVTDSGKNSPHIHVITKEDLYRFLLDNPNQNPIVNAYREKLQKWYTFS